MNRQLRTIRALVTISVLLELLMMLVYLLLSILQKIDETHSMAFKPTFCLLFFSKCINAWNSSARIVINGTTCSTVCLCNLNELSIRMVALCFGLGFLIYSLFLLYLLIKWDEESGRLEALWQEIKANRVYFICCWVPSCAYWVVFAAMPTVKQLKLDSDEAAITKIWVEVTGVIAALYYISEAVLSLYCQRNIEHIRQQLRNLELIKTYRNQINNIVTCSSSLDSSSDKSQLLGYKKINRIRITSSGASRHDKQVTNRQAIYRSIHSEYEDAVESDFCNFHDEIKKSNFIQALFILGKPVVFPFIQILELTCLANCVQSMILYCITAFSSVGPNHLGVVLALLPIAAVGKFKQTNIAIFYKIYQLQKDLHQHSLKHRDCQNPTRSHRTNMHDEVDENITETDTRNTRTGCEYSSLTEATITVPINRTEFPRKRDTTRATEECVEQYQEGRVTIQKCKNIASPNPVTGAAGSYMGNTELSSVSQTFSSVDAASPMAQGLVCEVQITADIHDH